MVQVNSLTLVACGAVFSFSPGLLECSSPNGSVVSDVVLVTMTDIAGASRVDGERDGTVTCTVVVAVLGVLPSLALVSISVDRVRKGPGFVDSPGR